MITKRLREDTEVEELAMANCMVLLSNAIPDRIFPCKTCGKQFSSFQALGGHRANHKKPRLMIMADADHHNDNGNKGSSATHKCSVCGMKFAMGQALGGHMRRHRVEDDRLISSSSVADASLTQSDITTAAVSAETASDFSHKSNNSGGSTTGGGSTKGLLLDLNLTPFENVVKFGRF